MQSKNRNKIIGSIFLGVFGLGSFAAIFSSSPNGDEIREKVNEEAKKASLSERLRANELKPIELGHAKVSDKETQNFENKNRTDKMVENVENKNKELSYTKNMTTSPWDAALTGKKLISDSESENRSEGNENNESTTKEKDAQQFVQIVNNKGLVKDAVIKQIEVTEKFDSTSQVNTENHKVQKEQEKPKPILTKFERLAKMSDQSISIIAGRERVAGRGQMFKAGTRVFAILPDKLTISSDENIDTSLIAFGSTEQKFPNNVTFVGKAKLNKPSRRVEIIIDKCVNTRDDSPPIPCKAIVKDILGDNGLSGKIYDPSNWQLLITTATTFLSTYVLSSLTTTVTQTGVTVDQTVANQVRQALGGSINAVGNRLIDSINRGGTEITIASGAIVQIFFTDTTDTWNID
ncbi:hypothetical protein [Fluviispira sanaruensis]|uniref:Uncharacterized protein n=1 Tax=Fluviispira sanaruensis TaxID=2493639 RepID=A0A4P2VR98_FLUSA|nr:hypothetical protein [Fluviispira sanaruensis]BBH54719.1 hypothetical protein JCM31447_31930 [Fluviispira sanaruensis]